VRITRIYTGQDGQSHVEELSLEAHPELSSMMAAKSINIRSTPAGHFMDWHPAPRRQFVINLQGEAEIGLPDGTTIHFGPGHVNLAEDVTGRGHTTKVVGSVPRITATIPLA